MNELFFSYLPGNSILHRLDPRTKLVSVMLLSVIILRSYTFQALGLLFCIFLLLSLITRSGVRHHFNSLRPMLFFFIFIFAVQALSSEGEEILSIGPLGITFEGICKGGLVTSRFVLLVLFASLLLSTTRPALLTLGIERMVRPLPLSIIGISSYDLAIMMSISMRFVPLMNGNLSQILQAQFSRGMDLNRHLLRGVSSMAVPMIHSTMRMAEDLAMAMESRCYQGVHRTSMFELKMHKADCFSLFIVACMVIFFFCF